VPAQTVPGRPFAPCARLMVAVLEDALETFTSCAGAADRRRRRLFAETESWFGSDDRAWPFSFASICDALDLDAGAIRSALARRREGAVFRIRVEGVAAARPHQPPNAGMTSAAKRSITSKL
jgi:hypothetical protein